MSARSSSGSRASIRSQKSSIPRQGNGVKSSGFYPVAMSPLARYNIVDHMNSHYRRIHAAKAAIDTTPPKSHQLRHSSPPSRMSSCSNSRSNSRTDHSQYAQVNREEVLQTTTKISYYLDALKREQQRLITQVASPLSHFRRPSSRNKSSSHRLRIGIESRNAKDLLEKHAEYFTTPEPFAPRLLRTDVKPRLQEYRWYNPPRRKELKPENVRERLISKRSDSSEYSEQWESEEQLDVADKHQKIAGGSRSHHRKRSSSHESLRSNTDLNSGNSSVILKSKATSKHRDDSFGSAVDRINTQSHLRQTEEDEEMKYLEFTVDVTNDILLRGIYTNKVLNQVFHSHLEKRRLELSMEKMVKALDQLKIDLGVVDDENVNLQTFGYGSLAANPHESKSKSCGDRIATTNGYPLRNAKQHSMNSTRDFEVLTTSKSDERVKQNSDSIAQISNLEGETQAHPRITATDYVSSKAQSDSVGVSENRTYGKQGVASDTASDVEDLPSLEENGVVRKHATNGDKNENVGSSLSASSWHQQHGHNRQFETHNSEEENSLSGDFYENDIGDQF